MKKVILSLLAVMFCAFLLSCSDSLSIEKTQSTLSFSAYSLYPASRSSSSSVIPTSELVVTITGDYKNVKTTYITDSSNKINLSFDDLSPGFVINVLAEMYLTITADGFTSSQRVLAYTASIKNYTIQKGSNQIPLDFTPSSTEWTSSAKLTDLEIPKLDSLWYKFSNENIEKPAFYFAKRNSSADQKDTYIASLLSTDSWEEKGIPVTTSTTETSIFINNDFSYQLTIKYDSNYNLLTLNLFPIEYFTEKTITDVSFSGLLWADSNNPGIYLFLDKDSLFAYRGSLSTLSFGQTDVAFLNPSERFTYSISGTKNYGILTLTNKCTPSEKATWISNTKDEKWEYTYSVNDSSAALVLATPETSEEMWFFTEKAFNTTPGLTAKFATSLSLPFSKDNCSGLWISDSLNKNGSASYIYIEDSSIAFTGEVTTTNGISTTQCTGIAICKLTAITENASSNVNGDSSKNIETSITKSSAQQYALSVTPLYSIINLIPSPDYYSSEKQYFWDSDKKTLADSQKASFSFKSDCTPAMYKPAYRGGTFYVSEKGTGDGYSANSPFSWSSLCAIANTFTAGSQVIITISGNIKAYKTLELPENSIVQIAQSGGASINRTKNTSESPLIKLNSGSSLTLIGITLDGAFNFNTTEGIVSNSPIIQCDSNTILKLDSGSSICNNYSTSSGSAIVASGTEKKPAKIEISGGTITSNVSLGEAGAVLCSNTEITMNSGSITKNYAFSLSGGIVLKDVSSSFIHNGGDVSGNYILPSSSSEEKDLSLDQIKTLFSEQKKECNGFYLNYAKWQDKTIPCILSVDNPLAYTWKFSDTSTQEYKTTFIAFNNEYAYSGTIQETESGESFIPNIEYTYSRNGKKISLVPQQLFTEDNDWEAVPDEQKQVIYFDYTFITDNSSEPSLVLTGKFSDSTETEERIFILSEENY